MITTQVAKMLTKKSLLTRSMAVIGIAYMGMAVAGPLEDLRPGEWLEMPNSRLDAVAAKPPAISQSLYDSMRGIMGILGLTAAWSGGAYDTSRERLILWGGGHGDYGGNEIYVFDMNKLAWERLNDPSPGPYDQKVLSDGAPASVHTYDGIEYIPPPVDRFYARGGGYYPSGNGSEETFLFDFANKRWERKARKPDFEIQNLAAYDPGSELVYDRGTNAMYSFNPKTNEWKVVGDQTPFYAGNLTMSVDPKRRLMVAIGDGQGYVWDLRESPLKRTNLSASGSTEIMSPGAPGFVYNPDIDRFVAWSGGKTVYILNMDTRVWSKDTLAASNTVTPTNVTASGGTFGRFQYVPSKKVFVAVNATNQNVYFYKLSNTGGGAPVPGTPAKPGVQLR